MSDEDRRAAIMARVTALAGLAAGLVLIAISLDLLFRPPPSEAMSDDGGD
jgi:hypothetical protein